MHPLFSQVSTWQLDREPYKTIFNQSFNLFHDGFQITVSSEEDIEVWVDSHNGMRPFLEIAVSYFWDESIDFTNNTNCVVDVSIAASVLRRIKDIILHPAANIYKYPLEEATEMEKYLSIPRGLYNMDREVNDLHRVILGDMDLIVIALHRGFFQTIGAPRV